MPVGARTLERSSLKDANRHIKRCRSIKQHQLLDLMSLQALTVLLYPMLSFHNDHSLLFAARTCRLLYHAMRTECWVWRNQMVSVSLKRPLVCEADFSKPDAAGCRYLLSPSVEILTQLRSICSAYRQELDARSNDTMQVLSDDHQVTVFRDLTETWIDFELNLLACNRHEDYSAFLISSHYIDRMSALSIRRDIPENHDQEINEHTILLIIRRFPILKFVELQNWRMIRLKKVIPFDHINTLRLVSDSILVVDLVDTVSRCASLTSLVIVDCKILVCAVDAHGIAFNFEHQEEQPSNSSDDGTSNQSVNYVKACHLRLLISLCQAIANHSKTYESWLSEQSSYEPWRDVNRGFCRNIWQSCERRINLHQAELVDVEQSDEG